MALGVFSACENVWCEISKLLEHFENLWGVLRQNDKIAAKIAFFCLLKTKK